MALLEAPDIQAKLEQARAAQAAAQAQDDKARKGARQEQIQAAYELWQKAKAGLTIAEKSYQRVKNLADQGVLSAQKLDEATAQRDAARATEKAAKSQYDMAVNGAEREDKAAAAALVERAKGLWPKSSPTSTRPASRPRRRAKSPRYSPRQANWWGRGLPS